MIMGERGNCYSCRQELPVDKEIGGYVQFNFYTFPICLDCTKLQTC